MTEKTINSVPAWRLETLFSIFLHVVSWRICNIMAVSGHGGVLGHD